MNDLLESIPSTNVKIIEIYNKIEAGSLELSPMFQRKLVWKKQHKFHFIETILKNYPFPEVYIASSEMDVTTITSKEIVVDGQQRLSTIVDYIKSEGDFKNKNRVEEFSSLTNDKKKVFLNYLVSVRDLKNINIDIIKDIFMRINNTEYSLNAVEKINAQYGDSEFIIFCKQLVDPDYAPAEENTDSIISPVIKDKILNFFTKSNIFSDNDSKRMSNLQFIMTLVSTLLELEYFSRNQKVGDYIDKFNAEFEVRSEVEKFLCNSIDMYESISFESGSYWFSKSNSFTLLVEFSALNVNDYDIVELRCELEKLDRFSKKYFASVDDEVISAAEKKYFEFAKEAVNARRARIYRGTHVRSLLDKCKVGE